MNSVYDVIEALRVWRGLTLKAVAERASISYTTLASIMKRRPEKISKNTLASIGNAFGVEWYKLLGHESEFKPVEAYRGRNINGERISAMMDETMVEAVLRNIIGERYRESIEWKERRKERHSQDIANYERLKRRKLRSQFDMCTELAFDNLNDDGVIEAMRYILELAQNPKYKKTDEQNNKEDTEWQKEKLPTAAERSD